MILVIFAAFVSSIIPEKYSKIANIAKKKSYLRVKENMEEEIMLPGKYQDGAISFDVKKPLTSTDYQGIKGFAIDMELEAIAIVSNNDFIENVKNGAALSDKETSTLYQLEEELGNDDDVTVYKIRQTNLFSVLSNIKIAYNSRRNFENDLDGDVQGICQNISTDEEKCNLFYNVGYSKKYNYNEIQDQHPEYISYTTPLLDSQGKNYTFDVKLGGYSTSSVSYELNFESIQEFKANIKTIGKCTFEAGFRFPKSTIELNNYDISASDVYKNEDMKKYITHYNYSKYGFNLSVDLYYLYELHLYLKSLHISNDLEINATAVFDFNKIFTYTTSDDEKIISNLKSFDFDISSNSNNDGNFDDFSFNYIPSIRKSLLFDINVSFYDFNVVSTSLQAGIENRYDTEMKFDNTYNSYCLFPYISYSYSPQYCPVFSISRPVKLLNFFNLINEKHYVFSPIWTGDRVGPRCFYGIKNPNPKTPIDSPVFCAKEISNLNSNQINLEVLVGDKKITDFNINGDRELNIVQKIEFSKDNLTFKGHKFDPNFFNSLFLKFYPNNFEIYSYLQNQVTTITDYYDINAKFIFNFYQGIELNQNNETISTDISRFAYFETSENAAIIQHTNGNNYFVPKTKIYDDQFSYEEDYIYHKKNNWKLYLDLNNIQINITVFLVNSNTLTTEQTFKYTDNCIFLIENRKLYLQLEFENNETKIVNVDIDFNQKKKIIITEKLYHKATIDIILEPYSTIVFFDIDNLDCDNETGLFPSHVLEGKDVYSFNNNNEITTKYDESTQDKRYLVYHLKTDLSEDDINETLFIVLVSQGFYPLSTIEEFPNEMYLVEFNEFTFENGFLVFNIPLVRNRVYKIGDEIKIKAIFAQPLQKEAFCPNSFHFTRFNSKIPIGCIDRNFDYDSILSLTSYDPEGNQYNPTKITPIVSTYIFINIFNNLVDSDCLISRIPTNLPEYSLTLSVGEFLANALVSYNVNYLKIKCDRCSGIFRNKEKFESDENHDINIKLDPEINDDYYAICSDDKGKYCIQKLTLNPTKVTLIKNPMVTVMTVLNYLEDIPQISIPKTQLFTSYGQTMILYSKDNIAGLEIDKELDPGFDVTLKAEVKGKHVRLYSITNDNTYIPFDPLSILSSFEDALNKLGLDSENVQFYHIRDEIFIHDITAFKKYPQDLSSEFLFGLQSTIITNINYDYNMESFQVQDVDYLCYCFVDSASQECKPIEGQCQTFIKLTPHEYNNFDVYLPEKGNGNNVKFVLNTDVINYHPSFELLPNDVWKVAVFSGDNSYKKFTGSLYIFPGQKVDCYPSINCNDLDVTIEFDVKNRKIGVFDASSSNSEVSVNFVITNELQCKVENYCSYSPDRETLLNVHHLKEYKFNTKHKQVSTTGEYVYDLIDNFNGAIGDSKGHYYLSIVYQENDVHLNEHFCVEDYYMSYCDKDQIPIGPLAAKGITKYIRSYPNIINHITLHFVECEKRIQPDTLIDISNNHYNIDISMESKSPFVFSDSLILYKNLNVSFGGQLNMENTILQQEVEVGIKQSISLNNKSVKKVEVTIICPPEKEIEFDSKQVLINGFDSNIEYIIVSESTCQLEHSSLSLSLSVDDSKLILNIQQNFNSYGNNICLFSDSASKCKSEYGLPIKLNGFTPDLITTNEQVRITLVDDFDCNLNLQSKNIIFNGNTKLSGTLELSSDSIVEILDLNINELDILLSLDIGKEEISNIKILNNDATLPHTFHLRLLNPNSNQFTKKFADLNMMNEIELNWISDESYYENYIISTELIIEDQSASVKINHITANKVLCYYNTDSTLCPPQATRDNTQMWKDFNDSIIYIAEDITVNSVNFNEHVVYFTGPGKLISNFYFYGSSNVHFLHKKLVEELNLFTLANFDTRKSPKIVFGEFESKPKSWSLQIQGYDTTCSFEIIYNGHLTPDELKNDQNTNVIIENIGPNTVIHFIEKYLPNSFCIYNYPYESYCYSKYPQYKPINSKYFWNIKLKPNYEPKFIFVSTLTTFLPLQRFQTENFNSAIIEILPFATCPKFLVPEGFTLKIEGESSDITAKISLNTNSFNYGHLLCDDDSIKIELVPIDGEFLYDEDTIIVLKQNNYIEFKPILEYKNEYKMIELNVIKNTIQYIFTSDKIDELYPFVSKELIALKLTSNCDLDISKLNAEKLVVFGDNHNLNINHEINTTLKLLLIDSANINFDSLLDLEVGVFNSNINIYPFATKQIMSSDLSYKYDNQIFPLDGSSVTITETTLIVNNKNIPFEKRNINLYVNDFCSIHDSSTKTINIYGGNSSINIEKSDQSLITFNNFEYLIVNSNDAFSNFHFHNNLLVDFNSPEKAKIDFYNLESGSGCLISLNTHSSIKQMNLFGKPFYSENADVSSLSVFDNKALMKGVKLTDSLHIDPGASLIAHSSTFESSVSSYFRLTSVTPLLILVDSTFDCSDLSIDVEYAYQHKEYTLIKGLTSLNSCENIKSKVSTTKKKKNYNLICYENPNDGSFDLIVTNIKNKPTNNKLSKGEIVAIVLPICCGIVVFIIILVFYFKNRNEQNEESSENEGTESGIQGVNNINNI